jgi:hypothetical protein
MITHRTENERMRPRRRLFPNEVGITRLIGVVLLEQNAQ